MRSKMAVVHDMIRGTLKMGFSKMRGLVILIPMKQFEKNQEIGGK